MPDTEELYIGMMSGTSVDGIDAALVNIPCASELHVIDTQFIEFPAQLRQQINAIAQSSDSINNYADCELHNRLADYYSQASLNLLKKANIHPSRIRAIANHGQTVRHEPNAVPPFSIQLGDPQQIANQTQIPTISCFRQADLAIGGQGAPLMPAFHKAVLAPKKGSDSYVLNIGGIANITQLKNDVIGFDTGPGNTLLDQWVQYNLDNKYDENGVWAQSGQCIPELLSCLLQDPYFSAAYPKSTGPDYFNLAWLKHLYDDIERHDPADIQATLLKLTVQTITDSVRQLAPKKPFNIYVCGGGAHNKLMMQELDSALKYATIITTDAMGIPPDWIEAAGFAWLGYCKVHRINSNLPSVTGAKKAVVLGEIFLPQIK